MNSTEKMKIDGLSMMTKLQVLTYAMTLIGIAKPKFRLEFLHLRFMYLYTNGDDLKLKITDKSANCTLTFDSGIVLHPMIIEKDDSLDYEEFSIVHEWIDPNTICSIDQLNSPLEFVETLKPLLIRKVFEVWSEGFHVQEGKDGAAFHGKIEAASFKDACDAVFKDNRFYNGGRLWGCRLFDNEADARRSFG